MELETASHLLTTLGKAEALHLDRSNIARAYILNPRESVLKRYHETSQAVSKTIAEAKSLAAGHTRVIATIDEFETAANTFRDEISTPAVELGSKTETYDRARDLASGNRASELRPPCARRSPRCRTGFPAGSRRSPRARTTPSPPPNTCSLAVRA